MPLYAAPGGWCGVWGGLPCLHPFYGLLHFLAGGVGVDLGGLDAGVAEEFADENEIAVGGFMCVRAFRAYGMSLSSGSYLPGRCLSRWRLSGVLPPEEACVAGRSIACLG